MYELADSIIKLRLATRKVCMCEGDAKKSTISLKTKVLALIEQNYSTKEILLTLMIAKTNLALLTKELAIEGLIEKNKGESDRREVCYSITKYGTEYRNERKKAIEESASVEDIQKAICEKKELLLFCMEGYIQNMKHAYPKSILLLRLKMTQFTARVER